MRVGPSIFLRADGRWEARYQKGRDENGKIIYGFVYGKSQDEAERRRADAIRALNPDADESMSMLASVNPNIGIPVVKSNKRLDSKFKFDKFAKPLDDTHAELLDRCFAESTSSAAIAFYLSLHMGLSISECVALRYSDIDMNNKAVYVSESVTSIKNVISIVPINKRIIPMPNMVCNFLKEKNIGTKESEHFVFTNSLALVAHSKTVTAVFKRVIQSEPDLKGILPMSLRATFIRRCLEANLNVESVSAITGVDKSYIYKFYGMYIKADLSAIFRLDQSDAPKSNRPKQLNLLILGAGSHGHNVKETAEKLGVFQKIRFLDDTVEGEEIVGRASDCALFVKEYPCAFVAIGDNEKRKYYTEKLRKCGFMLPTLIHPDTTVSKNAVIGEGTIIMAQATVNAATVGDCCIVASNALVNFGAKISDYTHLDCGAMVLKDAEVPEGTMVESGMIFRA